MWDFNQHKIAPERVELESLREFGRRHKDYTEDVVAFMALMNAGFELHFVPNG